MHACRETQREKTDRAKIARKQEKRNDRDSSPVGRARAKFADTRGVEESCEKLTL